MTLLNCVPVARVASAVVVVVGIVGAVAMTPRASALPPAATMIESVRAAHVGERTTVTLRGNGALTPVNVEESNERPRRLVLDFAEVSAPAVTQTDVRSPLVQRVRVGVNSRVPLVTRVVMEIADAATYHIERSGEPGHALAVVFEHSQKSTTVLLSPAEPVSSQPEEPISMEQALKNAAPLAPRAAAAPPLAAASRSSARSQAPALPVAAQTQSQTMSPSAEKRYIGTPVSLDLDGADLRATLRTLVEHGGLNVVFDPSVQGTVDIFVRDIPWDQALETILRANKLGYVAEGTIIRIAPLNVLADEEAERRKLSEARALAGDLSVQTFTLSYARAQDMQPLLTKSALSARGQIQVDTRTNTLIITDLADRLQIAGNLLSSLDKAQPQVEVEARIVQTSRDFAKAIGVQWGLNGRMTPDIGNTTGLAFPNRGTLGGRLGTQGRRH